MFTYYPLAAVFLTGKYRRGEPSPQGTRGHQNEDWEKHSLTASNFDALERYHALAAVRGQRWESWRSPWLLTRQAVGTVIVGATKPEHVKANLKAAAWELSPADLAAVDTASTDSQSTRAIR
jgi:aryl-alcohol dehydrogenase-like predicted oxidoreductase